MRKSFPPNRFSTLPTIAQLLAALPRLEVVKVCVVDEPGLARAVAQGEDVADGVGAGEGEGVALGMAELVLGCLGGQIIFEGRADPTQRRRHSPGPSPTRLSSGLAQ